MLAKRLILLVGLVVLIVASCARRSTPPGPDVAAGNYGQVSYVYLHWQGGVRIMLWHDIAESSTGGGEGVAGESTFRYGGRAQAPDGRGFDWQVETQNGRAAEFWIEETRYDLAEGELFIVRTQGAGIEVEQLQRDLASVQTNHESCIAFAESDPELRTWIGQVSAQD